MNCINTPSALEVLIHCHCSAAVHPRIEAPAVKEDIKMLLEEGLIQIDDRHYATTAKGKFYLEHLLSTPFPVQEFKIPSMMVGDAVFETIDAMLKSNPLDTNLAAQRLLRRRPSWEK